MRIQNTPFGSNPFKRGVAIITAALFLFTGLFSYAPAAFAQHANDIPVQGGNPSGLFRLARESEIRIPPELGIIDESFHGTSGKTIVFIQDAHDSLEAQENIAKSIDRLVKDYGVKTVFEEGYEGPVPTDKYFGFIKDPKLKEKVSYFLMDHLRVGGAEYAHINRTKDFDLIGADSLKLHRENIGEYRRSAKKKDAITRDLKALEKELKSLADSRFSKEFREWLKMKEQYDAKKLDLFTYLGRTMPLLGKQEADKGLGLISFILEAMRSNDPVVIEKAKHIDAREVFGELIKIDQTVAETFLHDAADKQLFEYYKILNLLDRLNDLQVSQEEYEAVKESLKTFDTNSFARFIFSQAPKTLILSRMWERNIKDAIRFYEIAQQRDKALSDALDQYLAAGNGERETETFAVSRSPSAAPAVLVYGGFHKENIKRILEAKEISYLIVSPRITKPSPRHEEFYKRLMTDGVHKFEIPLQLAKASRTLPVYVESFGRAEVREVYDTLLANPQADLGILDRMIGAPKRSEVRNSKKPSDRTLKLLGAAIPLAASPQAEGGLILDPMTKIMLIGGIGLGMLAIWAWSEYDFAIKDLCEDSFQWNVLERWRLIKKYGVFQGIRIFHYAHELTIDLKGLLNGIDGFEWKTADNRIQGAYFFLGSWRELLLAIEPLSDKPKDIVSVLKKVRRLQRNVLKNIELLPYVFDPPRSIDYGQGGYRLIYTFPQLVRGALKRSKDLTTFEIVLDRLTESHDRLLSLRPGLWESREETLKHDVRDWHLDPRRIYNQDTFFLEAVDYFNRRVLGDQGPADAIAPLTWEKALNIYEMFRGDQGHPDYDLEIRRKRLSGAADKDVIQTMDRANAFSRDPAQVLEGAAQIYVKVAGGQFLGRIAGITSLGLHVTASNEEGFATPGSGHHRLAWFLMNFFLIRNGCKPFYFTNEAEFRSIESDTSRGNIDTAKSALLELLRSRSEVRTNQPVPAVSGDVPAVTIRKYFSKDPSFIFDGNPLDVIERFKNEDDDRIQADLLGKAARDLSNALEKHPEIKPDKGETETLFRLLAETQSGQQRSWMTFLKFALVYAIRNDPAIYAELLQRLSSETDMHYIAALLRLYDNVLYNEAFPKPLTREDVFFLKKNVFDRVNLDSSWRIGILKTIYEKTPHLSLDEEDIRLFVNGLQDDEMRFASRYALQKIKYKTASDALQRVKPETLMPVIAGEGLPDPSLSFNENPADVIDPEGRAGNLKAGDPEFYNLLFNPVNARRILAIATTLRNIYPYDETPAQGTKLLFHAGVGGPLEYALQNKLYFPLGSGFYITPATESFRRHLIFRMGPDGKIGKVLEIKIPGEIEDENHRIVEQEDITIAAEVRKRWPHAAMAAPVAFIHLPDGDYRIYGRLIHFDPQEKANKACNIAVFEYRDGRRSTNLPEEDIKTIATKYPRYQGDPKAVLEDIAHQSYRVLAMLHTLGYRGSHDDGTDSHMENFRAILGANGVEIEAVDDLSSFVRKGSTKVDSEKMAKGSGSIKGLVHFLRKGGLTEDECKAIYQDELSTVRSEVREQNSPQALLDSDGKLKVPVGSSTEVKLKGQKALFFLKRWLTETPKPPNAGTFRWIKFASVPTKFHAPEGLGLYMRNGVVWSETGELHISEEDVLCVSMTRGIVLVRRVLELFRGTTEPFWKATFDEVQTIPDVTAETLLGPESSSGRSEVRSKPAGNHADWLRNAFYLYDSSNLKLLEILRAALGEGSEILTPRQREVLRKRYGEGKTIAQIAREEEKSEKTVSLVARKALLRLKQLFLEKRLFVINPFYAAAAEVVKSTVAADRSGNRSEVRDGLAETAKDYEGKVVVVGASAHGYRALRRIIEKFPANHPPMIINEHLTPDAEFRKYVAGNNSLKIILCKPDTKYYLEPGLVLIGTRMFFGKDSRGFPYVEQFQSSQEILEVPGRAAIAKKYLGVDMFFASAAKYFGENVIAVILSGLGADGAYGVGTVFENGGKVLVQAIAAGDKQYFEEMPANAGALTDHQAFSIEKMAGGIMAAARSEVRLPAGQSKSGTEDSIFAALRIEKEKILSERRAQIPSPILEKFSQVEVLFEEIRKTFDDVLLGGTLSSHLFAAPLVDVRNLLGDLNGTNWSETAAAILKSLSTEQKTIDDIVTEHQRGTLLPWAKKTMENIAQMPPETRRGLIKVYFAAKSISHDPAKCVAQVLAFKKKFDQNATDIRRILASIDTTSTTAGQDRSEMRTKQPVLAQSSDSSTTAGIVQVVKKEELPVKQGITKQNVAKILDVVLSPHYVTAGRSSFPERDITPEEYRRSLEVLKTWILDSYANEELLRYVREMGFRPQEILLLPNSVNGRGSDFRRGVSVYGVSITPDPIILAVIKSYSKSTSPEAAREGARYIRHILESWFFLAGVGESDVDKMLERWADRDLGLADDPWFKEIMQRMRLQIRKALPAWKSLNPLMNKIFPSTRLRGSWPVEARVYLGARCLEILAQRPGKTLEAFAAALNSKKTQNPSLKGRLPLSQLKLLTPGQIGSELLLSGGSHDNNEDRDKSGETSPQERSEVRAKDSLQTAAGNSQPSSIAQPSVVQFDFQDLLIEITQVEGFPYDLEWVRQRFVDYLSSNYKGDLLAMELAERKDLRERGRYAPLARPSDPASCHLLLMPVMGRQQLRFGISTDTLDYNEHVVSGRITKRSEVREDNATKAQGDMPQEANSFGVRVAGGVAASEVRSESRATMNEFVLNGGARVWTRLSAELFMRGLTDAKGEASSSGFQVGERSNGVLVLVPYQKWGITSTTLHGLDTILSLREKINELIRLRGDGKDPLTIVDWGCGDGRGLLALANEYAGKNVRFIGFADQYAGLWDQAPSSVTFILDAGQRFHEYFKPGSVDFIFSNSGIQQYLLGMGLLAPEMYQEEVLKTLSVLKRGAILRTDNSLENITAPIKALPRDQRKVSVGGFSWSYCDIGVTPEGVSSTRSETRKDIATKTQGHMPQEANSSGVRVAGGVAASEVRADPPAKQDGSVPGKARAEARGDLTPPNRTPSGAAPDRAMADVPERLAPLVKVLREAPENTEGTVRKLIRLFESGKPLLLELGPGDGKWILEKAGRFKDTAFVALDIGKDEVVPTNFEGLNARAPDNLVFIKAEILRTIPVFPPHSIDHLVVINPTSDMVGNIVLLHTMKLISQRILDVLKPGYTVLIKPWREDLSEMNWFKWPEARPTRLEKVPAVNPANPLFDLSGGTWDDKPGIIRARINKTWAFRVTFLERTDGVVASEGRSEVRTNIVDQLNPNEFDGVTSVWELAEKIHAKLALIGEDSVYAPAVSGRGCRFSINPQRSGIFYVEIRRSYFVEKNDKNLGEAERQSLLNELKEAYRDHINLLKAKLSEAIRDHGISVEYTPDFSQGLRVLNDEGFGSKVYDVIEKDGSTGQWVAKSPKIGEPVAANDFRGMEIASFPSVSSALHFIMTDGINWKGPIEKSIRLAREFKEFVQPVERFVISKDGDHYKVFALQGKLIPMSTFPEGSPQWETYRRLGTKYAELYEREPKKLSRDWIEFKKANAGYDPVTGEVRIFDLHVFGGGLWFGLVEEELENEGFIKSEHADASKPVAAADKTGAASATPIETSPRAEVRQDQPSGKDRAREKLARMQATAYVMPPLISGAVCWGLVLTTQYFLLRELPSLEKRHGLTVFLSLGLGLFEFFVMFFIIIPGVIMATHPWLGSRAAKLVVWSGIRGLLDRLFGADEEQKSKTLALIKRFLASDYGPAVEVKREVDALSDEEKIALARGLIADPQIADRALTGKLSLEQLLLIPSKETGPATAALHHVLGRFLEPFGSNSAQYLDLYEDDPDALNQDRMKWKTVYALLWSAELLSARSEVRGKGAAMVSWVQGPSSQLLVEKAFENPQHFRNLLIRGVKIRPLAQYIGKANVAVDISRFCPVGCTNCYYGSKKPRGTLTTRDALTSDAIDKIIAFSGVANLRTINITGGGDPYVNPKAVYKLVENATAEWIDLYTSGFWAQNKAAADRIMNDLYQAFRRRKEKTRLVLRLSMDEFHKRNLGLDPIINLINTFQKRYKDVEGFELQVRTLMNDPTLDELIDALPVERVMVLGVDRLRDIPTEKQSLEGEERDSVTRYPEKRIITLKNGYSFTVLSRNRLEEVETMPNLHDKNVVRRVTSVYDAEMEDIFHNNTAIVLNNGSGEPGFDFGINWRGDVTLWGVRLTDNPISIYEHGFQEIRGKILGDVLYVSFMEKGIKYRNDIVSEVDPNSVLRQKAFGVRGQVSDENEEMRDAMIYQDARTRLYLSIRVLQDYIAEGRINSEEISGWPEEIRYLVSLDREMLKKFYRQSSYSIVRQYIENPGVTVKELKSLYQLVCLGHYDVTPEAMQKIISAIRWLDDEQKRFILGGDYAPAVNDDPEEQVRQINVALTKVIPMLRKQKAYINIGENINSEKEWRDFLISMLLDYDADTALDFLSALIIYLNNRIPDAALLKRFDFPLLVRLRKLTVRCHLWTSQAIVEFSEVLKGVLEKVQLKNEGKRPVVVEMGGGYCDLSFGLKELMRSGQVPPVKVVPTDGFYLAKIGSERSKTEYYDMDTVRARDIRELSAQDILDGSFRKKLGVDMDTPVVIIASHLPYDNNFESTLFRQSNVDDLVLITPITAESLVKESGEKGIVPSEKVWDINPSGFLDHRNWYSGLYTLEGRVQLALQVLSRKSRLEDEIGFVNGSANNRYFLTDADGRPIVLGEESTGKPEKENRPTLRQLLFKTSEPVYEYPQRVLLTPLMLENIRNAAVVSGNDVLNFLNSYLRAGFVSVDVVNNILAKIEDGSGEARLSLAEKRESLEIIDRVLGSVQDQAVAGRVREVQLYLERRFKMAFIHRSGMDSAMVKTDNMAAMAMTRTKAPDVQDGTDQVVIDVTREFRKVDALGATLPVLLEVKDATKGHYMMAERLKQRRSDEQKGIFYHPNASGYLKEDGFLLIGPLQNVLSAAGGNIRENPTSGSSQNNSGYDYIESERWTVNVRTDDLLVTDKKDGTTKTFSNVKVRNIHSVAFSPINQDIVLLSSFGADRLVEMDLRSGAIVWEWNPWRHGYGKNKIGLTIAEAGSSDAYEGPVRELTVAEVEDMLTRKQRVPAGETYLNVVDFSDKEFKGLKVWQKTFKPNWAGYRPNKPGKILATSFAFGQAVEIDAETGALRVIAEDLINPHGVISFGDDYMVTDTGRSQVRVLDKDFNLKKIYDFSRFPVPEEFQGRVHEWLQNTYPIGETLLATVDSRRNRVYVWDMERKIYSEYPFDPNLVMQLIKGYTGNGDIALTPDVNRKPAKVPAPAQRAEVRVGVESKATRAEARAPVAPDRMSNAPAVIVLESERINAMAHEDYLRLLVLLAKVRSEVRLVVPDANQGAAGGRVQEIRSVLGARFSDRLPEIARSEGRVSVFGFANDSKGALMERLNRAEARGREISGRLDDCFLLGDGIDGIALALLGVPPADLPLQNGLRYAGARFRSEVRAFIGTLLQTFVAVSRSA